MIGNFVGEDLKAKLNIVLQKMEVPPTCNIIPPNEYMSLYLLGRTGWSSSDSPNSSGAIHLAFPWKVEVQEA